MKSEFLLAIVAASAIATPQLTAAKQVASNEAIREILRERVDDRKTSVGIVVGVIEPQGRRVVTYGKLDNNDDRVLDGDTVYEIGSMSKVFTSLLLADMVQKGEVKLEDPIARYLSPAVKVPERNGRSITLVDLATHTSSLSSLPTNMVLKDMANPYADYSVKQLHEYLSSYQLPRDIGSQYEYSNLGAGLLGHVLALHAGTGYEALVNSRICTPLRMTSTVIRLTPELSSRLAIGHDESLKPVANWDLPTLAGAGALRSTANDLLQLLAANLGYEKTSLSKAMTAMLAVRRPTGADNLDIALGWHVLKTKSGEIVWHNGGTGGYRTFMGFDPQTKIGVVVLSNASSGLSRGIDDIGHHLLNSESPLSPAQRVRREISVDTKTLDNYVGQYEIAPNFFLTVTREGTRLFGQSGMAKGQMYAESLREFFSKIVDMQFTFVTDASNKATQLIIHQGGRDTIAKRVSNLPTVTPPKEVALEPKLLDRYVGRYQLAPNFVLSVTRPDRDLIVQATGQSGAPIYPASETEFFYKAVDAQITFTVDGSGKATSLVLRQNGREMQAKRVE